MRSRPQAGPLPWTIAPGGSSPGRHNAFRPRGRCTYPRNRRGVAPFVLGGIVVAVAAAAIVGGLVATGVIHLSSNGGGGGGPSAMFNVTFTETGLASGTSWSVTLAGATQSSTTDQVLFRAPNGNYTFQVVAIVNRSAAPSAGAVIVDGANVGQSVVFSPYPLHYSIDPSSGPPGGTFQMAGSGYSGLTLYHSSLIQNSSTVTTLVVAGCAVGTARSGGFVTSAQGEFNCTVEIPASGPGSSPGNYEVTGGILGVAPIPFTVTPPLPGYYVVTFNETGLQLDDTWSVTFNGSTITLHVEDNSETVIAFRSIPNGTYNFSVSARGYTADPASGTLTVNGASIEQAVTFTSLP